MKTRIILSLLLFATAFSSCDSGDDLNEIFLSHPWKLAFFGEGTKKTPPSKNGNYTMKFYDTTFTFTTTDGTTISGYWQADNKEKTFRCSQVRVTEGDIKSDTTAIKAEHILKNARYYDGDSNWLQIKIQKNTYMQFHNK